MKFNLKKFLGTSIALIVSSNLVLHPIFNAEVDFSKEYSKLTEEDKKEFNKEYQAEINKKVLELGNTGDRDSVTKQLYEAKYKEVQDNKKKKGDENPTSLTNVEIREPNGEDIAKIEEEIDKYLGDIKAEDIKDRNGLSSVVKDAKNIVDKYSLGDTEYANLPKWIESYIVEAGDNGTPTVNSSAQTWKGLVNLAGSSNGGTGSTEKKTNYVSDGNGGTKVKSDEATLATSGTAENGIYVKEDDKFTNKEIEYRSNADNLRLFNSYLDVVASSYKKSFEGYSTTYKAEEVKDGATILSQHPSIYTDRKSATNESVVGFDKEVSMAPKEYDILTKIMTTELEGLELHTLYQTIVDFNSNEDVKKENMTKYKDFIKYTANNLFPTAGDSFTYNESESKDFANTYFYYNSIATAVGDSDKVSTLNNSKKSVYTSVVEPYLKYTSSHLKPTETYDNAYEYRQIEDAEQLIVDDKDGIASDSDKKACRVRTAERNNEGINVLKTYYSGNSASQSSLGAYITPPVFSTLSSYTSYASANDYPKDVLENKETRPNSVMITDRYSILKDNPSNIEGTVADNKFLQMELIIYGALNPNAILENYGLDMDALPTDTDTVKEFKTYMQMNRDHIVELGRVGKALANFYKLMGYNGRSETIKKNIESMLKQISDDIFTPLGIERIISDELNIGDNIIPKLKKESSSESKDTEAGGENEYSNLKDNEYYYELFAWTGAFTPFQVNVNDMTDNMEGLSDAAKELYTTNNIGSRRSPVYAVQGNVRNIVAVKVGNVKPLVPITLRDFLKRFEKEDLVLFANALTQQQINLYMNNSIVISQSDNNGDGNQSDVNISTLPMMSDTTANVSKFIGPIYTSSCDPNYATDKGYNAYEAAENEAMGKLLEMKARKEEDGGDNQTGDPQVNTPTEHSAYSDKTYSNASQAAKLSQHITASHSYLNYALMWNTLQDGHQYDGVLEQDLDRSLYVDFLGNILTESGYVVVPAAANTTYYKDINNYYPFYTAMLLNSYPLINISTSSTMELQDWDNNKYVIANVADSGIFSKEKEGEQEGTLDTGIGSKNYKFKLLRFTDLNNLASSLVINMPQSRFYQSFESTENESIFRTPTEDEPIDFIDPITSYRTMGEIYAKVSSTKTETAKILTTEDNKFSLVTDTGTYAVSMQYVAPIGTDPSWRAVTQLLKMHLLNTKRVIDKDTDTELVMDDLLIPLTSILNNCSDDPKLMLLEDNFINYNESLKDNSFMQGFGVFFEGIYNKAYNIFNDNIMLFTPTINNIIPSEKLSLWLIPITYVIIVLATVFVILLVTFKNFTHNEDNLKGVVGSIGLGVVLVVYSLYGHPIVSKFLFTDLPIILLGDDMYDYYMYSLESKYKDQKNFFFDNNSKEKEENTAIIKIAKLSSSDIVSIRSVQSKRPEIKSIYYSPKHDLSRYNIVGSNIFIKGDGLYTTVDDLFNGSTLKDYKSRGGVYSVVQDLHETADRLSTYTPYYHILETLTDTVNTYTEDCNANVRIKNYANASMLTGRATSFYGSIFFIAPKHLDELKQVLAANYTANAEDAKAKLEVDESLSEEQRRVKKETLEKQIDNGLQEKVDAIDTAFNYILEGMGMGDDWLGLRNILHPENNTVFTYEGSNSMLLTDWYPDLSQMTEEEIDNKIITINQEVKDYVLTNILPVSTYFSDSTALKMTALRATIEFNKAFSEPFGKQYYPKYIETEGLDNKFSILSTYIPRQVLYRSSSVGLSYLLASTEGWSAILLGIIDMGLRLFLSILVIIALGLLAFVPFILFLLIILRRSHLFRTVYTGALTLCALALFRPILIITYRIDKIIVTWGSSLPVMGINIAIYLTTIWFIRRLVQYIIESMSQSGLFVDTYEGDERHSNISSISKNSYSLGKGTDWARKTNYSSPTDYLDRDLDLNSTTSSRRRRF